MSERETAQQMVPIGIRMEAQRCAAQNGRIDPAYLVDLYRRGPESQKVGRVVVAELLRMFGSVCAMVRRSAVWVGKCPRAGVSSVTGFAVRESSVFTALISWELLNRLCRSATWACLIHAISITEKYNRAAVLGWRVLKATPQQVVSGEIIETLQAVFG